MRSCPNNFAVVNYQHLRRFMRDVPTLLDFVGNVTRFLHRYESNRIIELRQLGISARADTTRVAVLQDYDWAVVRLRQEPIQRLDVGDLNKGLCHKLTSKFKLNLSRHSDSNQGWRHNVSFGKYD